MDELTARLPDLDLRISCRIGLWSAFGVWRIHRIGHILDSHPSVLAVAMHWHLWLINRDLLVIHADAGAVRVGIGENPAQQHFVGTGTDARNEVINVEGRLLDLGV